MLRAKTDPLLTATNAAGAFVPLDVAARCGHSELVPELIQQRSTGGCGGASGGVSALEAAAELTTNYVDAMAVLMHAGVVDCGSALVTGAAFGREVSVRYLLQRNKEKATGNGAYDGAYADACNILFLL